MCVARVRRAQRTTNNPVPECGPIREDYFECLHHRKEYTRHNQVVERIKELGGVPKEMPAPAPGDKHH